MKIKRITHIGIAVKDTQKAKKPYLEILPLEISEEGSGGGYKTVFMTIGQTNLELVESNDPNENLNIFIKEKGEGIHHIALEVEDIDQALEELKAKGVPLLDQQPRPGAQNSRIVFLDPVNFNGVVVELVQY